MADLVFNIAKGRAAEFYYRVDNNDPANSALVVMVLATSGLESDAVLRDKDDFAAIVSGATNEVTNTGYARKTLTDSDLGPLTIDDTNDRVDLDLLDQTWSTVLAGDGWSKIVVGYDSDTTAGTDSGIIPIVALDFVIVPDGSDIVWQLDPAGFFRAA